MSQAIIDIEYKCLPSTAFIYIHLASLYDISPVERGNILKVDEKDAKRSAVSLILSDIERGKIFSVGIEAFDKNNNLIDRVFLKANADKERKKYTIPAISGLWFFKKPFAFNKLNKDNLTYEGILIEPYKKFTNMITHECFLYKEGTKKRLHDACFYYDNGRLRVNVDYTDKDIQDGVMRGIGLDIKKTETAAGLLYDMTPSDGVNGILHNLWSPMQNGEIKMNVIELAQKGVDSVIVDNKKDSILEAIEKMKKRIAYDFSFDGKENLVFLSKMPVITFHRQCKKSFKIFCIEHGEAITVALDVADVYLHRHILSRKILG